MFCLYLFNIILRKRQRLTESKNTYGKLNNVCACSPEILGLLLHSNLFKNTDTEDNKLHFSDKLTARASRILHLIIYCVQGHFSAISFNNTLKVQFNVCSQLSKSKFERHHTSKNSVWKEEVMQSGRCTLFP